VDVDARVVEAANDGPALDQIVDVETGQQDLVEHPDHQFRLADGKAPHVRITAVEDPTRGSALAGAANTMRAQRIDYTPAAVVDARTDGCRMSVR
jgi:hypothetical protein